MRKYFLLSAAALMIATNANAGTGYAEVTANATIEYVSQMECSDLSFGKILLINDGQPISLTRHSSEDANDQTPNILSVSGSGLASCTLQGATISDFDIENKVELYLASGEILNLSIYRDEISGDTISFSSQLSSTDFPLDGEYTGSFTVFVTY
ncbi:MAG: hypothetical protein IJ019_01160 [Alphaproteobacteria bacterium]|nr:hypothetical protein [Alphaproteobacteria bacterium]